MEKDKETVLDKIVPNSFQRIVAVAGGTVVILGAVVVLLKLGKVMVKDVKDMGL